MLMVRCLILKALKAFPVKTAEQRKIVAWLLTEIRGCSSAGRAPALHAGGQEFEPPHLHQYGLIAQLVRARA